MQIQVVGTSIRSFRPWRVLAAVACLAGRATANPTVVLESYDGARPSALAEKHVVPLLKKLEDPSAINAWAALPASVLAVVGDRLPRDGNEDPTMTVSKIRAQLVEANTDAMAMGYDFAKAIDSYERGFRWVRQNPALVITDYEARQWLTEAYVGYVFALKGLKREEEARRTAEAQVISFSDTIVSAQKVGPKVAKPFEDARVAIEVMQKGQLLVKIADRTDASVAINYTSRGRGSSFQINAVARPYQILVQIGSTARRYEYTPEPTRSPDELRIDWELDSRLHVNEQWIGIEHDTPAVEHLLTRKLARHSVVTISIVDAGGRRWLVGIRHAAGSGRVLNRCVAELGSQAESAMAPCIVAGVRLFDSVHSEIPGASPDRARATEGDDGEVPAQWPMWTAFGGMIASTTLGIYFVSQNDGCTRYGAEWMCVERKHTALQATLSLSAGAGFLALTTYLYLRRDRAIISGHHSRKPLALGFDAGSHGGGMVTLSGRLD